MREREREREREIGEQRDWGGSGAREIIFTNRGLLTSSQCGTLD